ncbi:hypothetical protein V8G54_002521 [Vigna mungo]|uniref:Secreted protein n=1 Tax=Vigna mungo TaxID=3915 RepID=A0AAQ3PBJ6_VIGMU
MRYLIFLMSFLHCFTSSNLPTGVAANDSITSQTGSKFCLIWTLYINQVQLYFFDQLLAWASHQRLVFQWLQLRGPANLVSNSTLRLAKWMRSHCYLDHVNRKYLMISSPWMNLHLM